MIITEDEWPAWIEAYAQTLAWPFCLHLKGPLGAGKTTLARTLIKHLGGPEPILSPTYVYALAYPCRKGILTHMDLYRLNPNASVEDLYDPDTQSFIIEWPTLMAPDPTHHISIEILQKSRKVLTK
jgi:tRNA threonylcarbamoyladenosine biosynthesis protein TsaE